MRVAMLLEESRHGFGGIERAALRLSQGIAERGHQVDLLIQSRCAGAVPPLREPRITVRNFAAPWPAVPIAPALAAYLCRRAAGYDIVHVHNYHAPLALAAAAVPCVTLVFSPHYHGRGRTRLRQALHHPYHPLGRYIFSTSAAVICASAAEAELCRAHFTLHREPVVVHHGVDAEAIAGAEPFADLGRIVFGVGRLEHYKRVDRVIAAMQHLEPDWLLVLAGTGPAEHSLHALCHRLNLTGRVAFLGAISDQQKHRWLRTARALVTLSSLEAYGLTVLEAVAAGLPVVASDIPAYREHASASYGGDIALVSPDCDPQGIAAHITAVTATERGCAQCSPAMPTWDEAVSRTLGAYELALRRRPVP